MERKFDESNNIEYFEEIINNLRYTTHPAKVVPVAESKAKHSSGKTKTLYKTAKGNFFSFEFTGNYVNPKFTPMTPEEARLEWKSMPSQLYSHLDIFGFEEEVEDA